MRQFAVLLFGLFALVGLSGCEVPYAQVATLQDPKYPVGKQSKITFQQPDLQKVDDLPTRLNGEALDQQMHDLGFTLTPTAGADYLLTYEVVEQGVPVSYSATVPTISSIMGTNINGSPVSGTIFGETAVPLTKTVNMTQLKVTLGTLGTPSIIVWQGRVAAETVDAQKYRVQFVRALIAHIGETFNGSVKLPEESAPAK